MAGEPQDVVGAVERAFAAVFPGVVSAYLFGSYSLGRAHAESDVDIGVLLRHAMYPTARERFEARLRLIAELQPAIGREVDLVILNDAPPPLARRIVIAGRRVFAADPKWITPLCATCSYGRPIWRHFCGGRDTASSPRSCDDLSCRRPE
jgi:predicted nucleotidyltransferase